jgi:pimeloyl-ACP methyl ester carboxylesterase
MGGYDQGLTLGCAAAGPDGFEFLAVSRPGYLATPLALGRTPEQQADLCAAVLDALAIPQSAVIAVSGGGQCALQFALRHPERCRALVMISACSAPLTVRVPLKFYLMMFLARFPALISKMRKKVLEHPESDPLFREQQLSVMDRMAERLAGTRNDIRQSRAAFAYPLEQIRTPTLIVHGAADEAVPFAQAESLRARLPNAELLAIPDGRHVCLFTHRSLIQPRVRQFLENG